MLTDEKFCEAAMKFCLVKDTDGKYFTLDEYRTLIEPSQTDKEGNVVYLYATDPTAQYNYIRSANDAGYSVLVMDGQLDSHFVGLLEQKLEKSRFVRVDSDVITNLIPKADKAQVDLTATRRNILTTLFKSQIPEVENSQFIVSFEALGANGSPVVITQNEYMRRMKEMAALQPGMNFYGQMPDSYSLVVNTDHPLVKKISEEAGSALDAKVEPLEKQIDEDNSRITALRGDKASDADKAEADELVKKVDSIRADQTETITAYAATQPVVRQLIDLALLGNGLLRGAELSRFISRSVELL